MIIDQEYWGGPWMLWTVAVLVLWESIGTTFSLLPAVASRDEYKLLPRVSTDFLLGFCHC